jgi:hypothetical protein
MLRAIHGALQDTGNIHMILPHLLFPMAGACRPASEANVPINWRALPEHSELARPHL